MSLRRSRTCNTANGVKLISLAEYRRLAFVGKPPCINTLKSWIDKGIIQGEKIGGLYFVHVGEPQPPVENNDLLRQMVEG